jgi:hypothetical protein
VLDPRQVPQVRSRRTSPPLMRFHSDDERGAIFPRISACQGSLSCLNTLLYEED